MVDNIIDLGENDIPVGSLFICKDEGVLAVKWVTFWDDEQLIDMKMVEHIIDLGEDLKKQLEKANTKETER